MSRTIHQISHAQLWTLIVAVIVGLIYALPNVIYPVDMGSVFQGVALVNSQDEWAYTGFSREAAEGNWLLQSQYVYELKTASRPSYMTLQPIPFWILGGLFRASAMDVQIFTVLSKFVFSALLFYAVTFLLRVLQVPWRLGLLGAGASLLMPAVWWSNFVLFDPKAIWAWHLVYARPGANIAVLFLVVACALVLEYAGTGKRSHFWAAVILGSLAIQSYFFVAAAYCSLLVVMGTIHFVWGERRIARELMKMLVLSCVASVWMIYNGLKLLLVRGEASVWTSGAMEYRWPHLPIVTLYAGLSLVLLLILVRFRKKLGANFTNWTFIVAIPTSHLLCLNQQVITGIILEPHHFDMMVYPILTWIAFAWLAFHGGQRLREKYKGITVKSLISDRRVGIGLAVSAIVLLTPLLLEPHVPRPSGGIFGRIVRGGAIFDRTFVTWLTVVPILYMIAAESVKSPAKSLIWIGVYLGSIALITQVNGYMKTRESFSTVLQPYAPAFRWLETNSPKESVVLCSPLVGDFLPTYSHNNVYFCDYAVAAPPADFRRRLINQLIFSGLDPDQLFHALDPGNAEYDPALKSCFFYWREMGERGGAKYNRNTFILNYTNEDVGTLVDDYARRCRTWTVDSLRTVRVDYVLLGPIERGDGAYSNSHWRFARGVTPFITPSLEYDDGKICIYRLP